MAVSLMWHLVFILLSTFLWTRMHRPQPQDCHWTWVMSHFRLAIRSHFLLVLHNHTITSCNRLLFVVLSLRVFSWHFVSRGCACFSVRTVLHYVTKYSYVYVLPTGNYVLMLECRVKSREVIAYTNCTNRILTVFLLAVEWHCSTREHS